MQGLALCDGARELAVVSRVCGARCSAEWPAPATRPLPAARSKPVRCASHRVSARVEEGLRIGMRPLCRERQLVHAVQAHKQRAAPALCFPCSTGMHPGVLHHLAASPARWEWRIGWERGKRVTAARTTRMGATWHMPACRFSTVSCMEHTGVCVAPQGSSWATLCGPGHAGQQNPWTSVG